MTESSPIDINEPRLFDPSSYAIPSVEKFLEESEETELSLEDTTQYAYTIALSACFPYWNLCADNNPEEFRRYIDMIVNLPEKGCDPASKKLLSVPIMHVLVEIEDNEGLKDLYNKYYDKVQELYDNDHSLITLGEFLAFGGEFPSLYVE